MAVDWTVPRRQQWPIFVLLHSRLHPADAGLSTIESRTNEERVCVQFAVDLVPMLATNANGAA